MHEVEQDFRDHLLSKQKMEFLMLVGIGWSKFLANQQNPHCQGQRYR